MEENKIMKSGTQDRAEGKFHKVTGKLREFTGKKSINSRLKGHGIDEKISGKAQK
ncbi:MAG: CsbD family protein [Spirochaetes bacterium]|nr:CsbD family protein [Spirochaetota bacterium]